MELDSILIEGVSKSIKHLYNSECEKQHIQIQKTKKEFEGDITIVVFPLLRYSKKSPEITANEIGNCLLKQVEIVEKYEAIKGFLNLTIKPVFYIDFLKNEAAGESYGFSKATDESEIYMVEYSSPNTNKPLHLGHIRNNLLGWSICNILHANGKKVIKTNIVNDRGIHICKSMFAWQEWGNNETPESSGKKGDHLVGEYYVKFNEFQKIQLENILHNLRIGNYKNSRIAPNPRYKKLLKKIYSDIDQGKFFEAPILELERLKNYNESDRLHRRIKSQIKRLYLIGAIEMLRKWEANDQATIDLWQMMNSWVYAGFDVTYKRLGVGFDKIYYESDTYKVGRDTVIGGIDKGAFYLKEDKSVWVDLTKEGLDEKLLLRADGTSVYITQDIGTAQLRQTDYSPDKMIYVVGNEQNYHFKVLSLILDKLNFHWAKDLYHLSYGMVELPEGKMKSREGTVVDADDLMDEMIATARSMADELGKLEGLSEEEKEDIYRIIGLGALKYFILKVDPVKNMTFNPQESIDFNGNTGPFIQYTYARICSIMRKANEMGIISFEGYSNNLSINEKEKSLLKLIHEFPEVVSESAKTYNPALIANYTFDLVKEYNQFYHDYTILKEEDENKRVFRLNLSEVIRSIVKRAMGLLGIELPERM